MTTTEITAARIGAKAGIDPIIAAAVISALVQLVTLCMTSPTPEKVVETARKPSLIERAIMKNAAYRELRKGKVPRRKRRTAWLVVLDEIAVITPEEAEAICLDCQITADFDH